MKDYIFENWQYKLLALGFAIFFWYVVIGQQRSEITLELPIEFQNVPENFVIINNPVKKVSVLLSGPSAIIKDLTRENLSFPIDLSNIKIGKNVIYLLPKMLKLPKKIKVKLITPSKITIVVDLLEKKEIPVIPNIVGKLKPGFKIDSIKVIPPLVTIVCTKSELEKLTILSTQPIDISNKSKSFSITVPVRVNVKFLRSINPSSVKVKINIVENLVKMSFKNIPIKIKSSVIFDSYKPVLNPDRVTITFEINKTFSKIISKKDFQPYINIDSLTDGKYKVKIDLPENIKLISIQPQNVQVKFKKIIEEKK